MRNDVMRKLRVRRVAVLMVATLALVSCNPDPPPPVEQFQHAVNLGLNMSLTSFNNIQSVGTETDRYWWFDWRTDGCSSGPEEYRIRFFRACGRHDFSWKNFYEIEYYHHEVNSWNNSNRDEIDDQFQWDMSEICDGGWACLVAANTFELAVSAVPFGNICYDHYHWRSTDGGHIKIANHPDSGCN